MNDFIKRTWLPFAGAGSSVSFKGITDLTTNHEALSTVQNIITSIPPWDTIFWYFLVGAAGAAGGLIIKIVWGCLKKWVPILKNIDK